MSRLSTVSTPLALLLADLPPAVPGSADETRLGGLVGRKALSLAQSAAHGLPVPPAGAVTTAAYAAMLATEALQAADTPAAIHAALHNAPMPAEVSRAIAAIYQQLGGGAVAVRSSGAAEDLAGASFAGMYESFLNIEGEAAVELAVRRCWASAWSERVAAYAERRGVPQRDLAMGVVIQRLVPADAAGVLFSLDPTSGREEHMRVEACLGLGEALVAGNIQPDGYLIERADGQAIEATVPPRETKLARQPGGGIATVALTPAERQGPVLDAAQLMALAALGRRAQAYFGCPQDVEWAIADGKLWLLQSRPITTIAFTGIAGEWTTADFKDGGVSATVCSPYMWSLYDAVWQHAMPTYLAKIKLQRPEQHGVTWGRVFYGRPYWNCGEVKRCLHRVPGFNERTFDRDLGIEGAYEGDGVVVPVSAKTVLGALPTLFALEKDYQERIVLDKVLVRDFDTVAARYDAEPAGLERAALAARFRELLFRDYFATESAYFHTIYNTSNAKLDFKVELDKANQGQAEPLSYLALLSGLRDLRHLEPLRDLWALASEAQAQPALKAALVETPAESLHDVIARDHATFFARVVAFLHAHRHHSVAELDITQPRWNEDPIFVWRQLQGFVATFDPARDPVAAAERQHEVYLAELARARALFARKGWLARWIAGGGLGALERGFFAKLERCRNYAWWREELRDRSSRMYALVRRETLAAGRLLARAGELTAVEDVWQLKFEELADMLDGRLAPEVARTRVAERREYGAGWQRFTNPNELGLRFKPAADVPTLGGALTGIACSPGRVKARVRVVPSIGDAHALQPGEVLVTKFTDPGWTPLFSTIAAVVTETGGVLSHAAVIAREYGIPAVLAVQAATQRLRDGQLVWVDGQAGTVTVADEETL